MKYVYLYKKRYVILLVVMQKFYIYLLEMLDLITFNSVRLTCRPSEQVCWTCEMWRIYFASIANLPQEYDKG